MYSFPRGPSSIQTCFHNPTISNQDLNTQQMWQNNWRINLDTVPISARNWRPIPLLSYENIVYQIIRIDMILRIVITVLSWFFSADESVQVRERWFIWLFFYCIYNEIIVTLNKKKTRGKKEKKLCTVVELSSPLHKKSKYNNDKTMGDD